MFLYMFLFTLNKKGTKIVDNLKIIVYLGKLLLISNVDFLFSLKTQKTCKWTLCAF